MVSLCHIIVCVCDMLWMLCGFLAVLFADTESSCLKFWTGLWYETLHICAFFSLTKRWNNTFINMKPWHSWLGNVVHVNSFFVLFFWSEFQCRMDECSVLTWNCDVLKIKYYFVSIHLCWLLLLWYLKYSNKKWSLTEHDCNAHTNLFSVQRR